MKNISFFPGRIIVPVIATAMLISACDSSNGFESSDIESEDLDQTVAFLALDLGLNATGSRALSGAFAQHEGQSHEPGFLWRVAADLQQRLTEEQKQKLFDRYENIRSAPGAGLGQGGRGQGQPGQGRQGPGGFGQQGQGPGHMGQAGGRQGPGQFGHTGGEQGHLGGAIELTEDQKAQIKAIRDAHAEEFRTLMDSRRNGSLSVEDFRTQMEALQTAIKSEVDAVLTDEQKQQLEDLKAQRDAERADREAQWEADREAAKLVMIEVMGLGDDQVTALDDLHAARETLHTSIKDLIENGAGREEIREMLESARADFEVALAGILDGTQLEIFKIHAVIAQRMKNRRGHGGNGTAGQMPGGQNGAGFGKHNGSGGLSGFGGMSGGRGRRSGG